MPMAPRKPRPQSARLDVLAMMMSRGNTDKRPVSPADSLSPCREDYTLDKNQIPRSHDHVHGSEVEGDDTANSGPEEDDWFQSEPSNPSPRKAHAGLTNEAGTETDTPSVQTTAFQQEQQEPSTHVPSFPKHSPSPAVASHISLPPACEPRCLLSRPHRPGTISVDETSGSSTLPAYELKQAIREATSSDHTPQTLLHRPPPPPSSPERGRRRHRRSPALLINSSSASMGNQHSHHDSAEDGALDADDRSTHSIIRASRLKAARLPRRSSMNVFKRLDSKSPLPVELSATVIEVPRAATAPNLDGMADDDETGEGERERSRARHAHRHSAPSPSIPVHPESPTATLTEESAARPLSASDTITDRRNNTQADDYLEEEDSPSHLRVSALSPTLPAPSPIPEDSPHKYGLKDRMDTPENDSPPPPKGIDLNKARRRSSGFAIFNEAKTLQSASSFLNGLSTARRRAESRAQSRNATDNSQNTSGTVIITDHHGYQNDETHRLSYLSNSVTASTIHPYNSISHTALPQMATEADLDLNIDIANGNLGHIFKSSGYAYAPPMSITQIKCYRSHNRLLPSRNKNAPVECAVCHADDESQHWSCGWCALRMCGGCRKVLETSGVAGLRERVRASEMGAYC